MTPVIQLIDNVWNEQGKCGWGHSWDRLNHSLAPALSLAIEFGFKFERGDFTTLLKKYRFERWCGEDMGEGFYSLACCASRSRGIAAHGINRSAAISFEKLRNRKPFLYRPPRRKDKIRLAVGSQIWRNETSFYVTSFADDGSYLVACAYKGVTKRIRLTADDLKAANKG